MCEVVSFDLAQKLKEKGFREKVEYFYDRFGNEWHCLERSNMNDTENCSAPTISQVLKWLREEKQIHLGIDIGRSGWYVTSAINIKEYDDGWDFRLHHSMEGYSSYEEVALAGIDYVIDSLI